MYHHLYHHFQINAVYQSMILFFALPSIRALKDDDPLKKQFLIQQMAFFPSSGHDVVVAMGNNLFTFSFKKK
tara:strand:- start:410 stop:625 length:216 start_codon:yes stop_codon:yes gene_type:complete